MPHHRLPTVSFIKPRVIIVSLTVAALITLVGVARTGSSGAPTVGALTPVPDSSGKYDRDKKAGRAVETELIALRPTGFEPAEITRPAGEFILMVENRTGGSVSLRFSRATGERLHEVRASREEPDWNELEDLAPGRYLLAEADHPEWSCRVTVTAR